MDELLKIIIELKHKLVAMKLNGPGEGMILK